LDTEALGHGDLHALHVVPVPDRLEEGVVEPEQQQVLHRLLAEIVVDAEDRRLLEGAVQRLVERARRSKVASERLFDHQPRPVGATRLPQPLDDDAEHAGGDGQVMGGTASLAQLTAERLEGGGIGIVAAHVAEALEQLADDRLIDRLDVLLQAIAGTRLKLLEGPGGVRHADDRHVQVAAPGHVIERGEDLLVGQISAGAEEDEGVRVSCAHTEAV
jgi:hypothetical protein